mgnify:CR=1 FL=1
MQKAPLAKRVEHIEGEAVRSILRTGAKKPDTMLLPDFYTPRAIELLTDYILELEEERRKLRAKLEECF